MSTINLTFFSFEDYFYHLQAGYYRPSCLFTSLEFTFIKILIANNIIPKIKNVAPAATGIWAFPTPETNRARPIIITGRKILCNQKCTLANFVSAALGKAT